MKSDTLPRNTAPKSYRVTWEIEIDSDSAQQAAEQAAALYFKEGHSACVFQVRADGQEAVTVDLMADDGAPPSCPKCGGNRLQIEATVSATVEFDSEGDHQLEDTSGDVEWSPASACTCASCGHTDRLAAFR